MKAYRFVQYVFLMLAIGHIAPARAEYGCQAGFIPVYQNGQQACVADYNLPVWKQSSAPLGAPQVWKDQWGAIAADDHNEGVGVSSAELSKRAAKNTAILDCKRHGGIRCEIKMTYANQCIAAVSSTSDWVILTDKRKEVAEKQGMDSCVKRGKQNCHIYYSACSYPIRVR